MKPRGSQIFPSLPSPSNRQKLSRRRFLKGTAIALAVVGFDPNNRSWATELDESSRVLVSDFPHFDGELLIDEASLAAAADDFGHAVSRRPIAVLNPGSVRDIERLIRFARLHRIDVAARGQGHSTGGQAQVNAGVVIAMSALDTIHEISSDASRGTAWVDAGTRWIDLIRATVDLGLRPAVTTDYIDLSIGGTLSVGGLGSQSPDHGAQIDNILELEVVTGRGRRHRCSPRRLRPLFQAVRGGLGQFGVITKARIRLVPAAPLVRYYRPAYTDLSLLLDDLQLLMNDGRFDGLQCIAEPADSGYVFHIEAAKEFSPGNEPDDAVLLQDLRYDHLEPTQDLSQFDYLNRLAPTIEFLKQIGVWGFPHPWLDVFIPASQALRLIGDTLDTLDPADVNGPILINPYRRSRFTAPFFRLPDEEIFFIFDILRTAVPPTPERTAELITANREIYDRARPLGGLSYRIGSLPFDRTDWEDHFGGVWPAFKRAKRIWDPAQILAPGTGIFRSI